jgi:LAGLIDADG endonuclease
MQIIIDHFDKFPLMTKKLNDFKLFKLAYNLFIKKEHLSIEGIEKLVKIKSSMNLGLSPQLKTTFANIKPNKEEAEVSSNFSNICIKKIPDPT